MKLPEKVYLVQRIPPEGERIPYYGRSLVVRLYRRWNDVKLFLASNPSSQFRVFEADVSWTEINPEGASHA